MTLDDLPSLAVRFVAGSIAIVALGGVCTLAAVALVRFVEWLDKQTDPNEW